MMLDTEIKVLSTLDIADAIIMIAESQVRLRKRLEILPEEIEQLKHNVMES